MSDTCMDLWAVVPEMILAGLALVLVPIAGWIRGRWRWIPSALTLGGLLAGMAATASMMTMEPQEAFCGTYAVDPFRAVYQLIVQAGAFVTVLALMSHFHEHQQEAQAPIAVLFATIGGMGLIAATDLGLIVLFLQMVSVPSYLLVGMMRSDKRAQEAMLKYFIYAATALAIMAYGLTFLFGLTGSLNLRVIGTGLASADAVWVAVALGLVLIGYGFEMTIVPFQFWAPDVFQGASAPAAGFISVVPKIAAFAALLRFLLEVLPNELLAWPMVLAVIAAGTMTFGNLVALRQLSLKRLLAYSSIAQAGYVLMGMAVSARTEAAQAAVSFYLFTYMLMNLAAFTVVGQMERSFGSDELPVVRGMGRYAPWPAAALTLALLSLAGIPPLAGFAGKVFLLMAAIDGGMSWLAIIAALNMVAGLYYYAVIVAEMYFRAAGRQERITTGSGYAGATIVTTLGTVALGIAPSFGTSLTDWARVLLL
jgi:NADH-quinone oxidoreductase subunit N